MAYHRGGMVIEEVKLSDLAGGKCTQGLVLKLRQPLYSCRTCNNKQYLCKWCRDQEHAGHDCVYLGLRRGASCESGREELLEDADNQTRLGRFCWCSSNQADGEMWQCVDCEDWFHLACIQAEHDWVGTDTEGEFVCRGCVSKRPAFWEDVKECVAVKESVGTLHMSIILPSNWSDQLCKCQVCLAYCNANGLWWVHDASVVSLEDPEDTIEDDMDTLDKAAVLDGIDGYHKLKLKLKAFLENIPNGHTVTEDDVKSFFGAAE